MGTQEVYMKGVLPWLVHWARRAGTRDFCPVLAAQDGPVQGIFSSLFHFIFTIIPEKMHTY
jgi:hypothetical protein